MRNRIPLLSAAFVLFVAGARVTTTTAEPPGVVAADKAAAADFSLQTPPAPSPPKAKPAGKFELTASNLDGLKYSLELRPADKHAYPLGEPIQMVLKVRNPAEFAVTHLYSTREFYAAAFTVTDAAGKSVEVVPPAELFGNWAILKKVLAPREEIGLAPLQLVFQPAGPRAQSHSLPTVYAVPGKYKIGYPGTEPVEVELK